MKTIDISGMGGGYEATCQKALLNGMRFIKEHPDADYLGSYKVYQNIYGVLTSETQIAHELDKALSAGIPERLGLTGGMHQAVISHLLYIAKQGYEKWLAEFDKDPNRVYEIEEENIDKLLMIEAIEWDLKLESGYDPLEELRKAVPEENWIIFDTANPEPALNELKKRLGAREEDKNDN